MAEHDNSAEADLQLKKRARRRLVGAIALALLAVIVLPMVMDREPRPAGQDIQVRIPSQDAGGLATKVLPAKPAATPMPAPEPKSVAEPVPGVQPKGDSAPPALSPAVEAAKPKSAAAKPEPVAVPAKPAVAAAPAAKPPAKPAPEAKPATEKPAPGAQAANGKKNTEARGAAAEGQWVVQLGAFRETGNVKLLMSKLKELKLPAYTEKYDSPQGPRTRVRAGPFPTQDAAEKARARIKIIGVDGSVAQK